ncbi:CBM35 domain-containing protein [Nonomuraea sediminis]|uniref:CBM35 domain-containing protein n=1 Tax=Nonomuraea sediminis TaxID=2835864 RepID=UPI001BDC963E|nr:CBM35 domain-containing protein [Nonomuraea sediminis]
MIALLLGGTTHAYAATTQQTFLTFYGWWDNTPPGGDISYPQIHSTAGGKGTYADPITFATSSAEARPGTKIYVPRVKKYFIMEDSCQECGEDWSGHGPNGGPGLWHFDLWLGGKGGNAMNAIDCEDALTHYNADSTPTMEPVIINPGSNETYDPTPIFNTSTGECYGGAKPNTTVGSYKNGSSGQCLDDPNNSSTSGTALKVAACTGAANQRFTFHGAFLVINNLCAAMSGSSIVLNTCTGGPSQQWSVNPNGTISDIQTGQKCIRQSGSNAVAGSCSGTASQWTFTPASDVSLGVTPTSGSTAPGGSVTATVAATGAAQQVTLSASGLPAGASAAFDPASVTVPGNSTLTIATTDATPPGTYPVTISGAGATAVHTLTVTGSTPDYQAEDAVLSQAGVFSNHTGFTGTGFVDYVNAAGGYIEWTVNAATAGSYSVAVRYANGTTTDRPMDIAVNGATASSAVFTPTANWDTWATKSVTVQLAAGTNKIRATGTGSTGGPNVDKITVTPVVAATDYQAEDAVLSAAGVFSNHTGFTGTGFVDYVNAAGGYIEWTVNAATAGSYTLAVRYANGTTADRPVDIAVNGATVSSVVFTPTANWDTWATKSVTVQLAAGANKIRATGTGATGGPNVDKISIQ